MLFPTVAFAIFFTVVLALNWLLMPRPVVWRLFIIGASWAFYGWWDARFVALLAGSTLGNYLFGIAIWRSLRPSLESGTLSGAGEENPRSSPLKSPNLVADLAALPAARQQRLSQSWRLFRVHSLHSDHSDESATALMPHL
jgi:hypothetical protein